MSQRVSGFQRKPLDGYETPEWVTEALIPHLPRVPALVWEPAAGTGKMVTVLARHALVHATDITAGVDFLTAPPVPDCDGIITNPPFALAARVIEHALALMEPCGGIVAMLLRVDFDSAKTRRHLFADCPAFAGKLVLTRRITWFEGGTSSPSFNHCWMTWDWRHRGPPTLAYALASETA
jgi:hypothetical protein